MAASAKQRKQKDKGDREQKRSKKAHGDEEAPFEDRAVLPLTKYERVRVLGERAARLASGRAAPTVRLPGVFDPLRIAEEELRRGTLRCRVLRPRPDGERDAHDLRELAPP
jgi:DNA-directed RNA polymerase subunit K/omega